MKSNPWAAAFHLAAWAIIGLSIACAVAEGQEPIDAPALERIAASLEKIERHLAASEARATADKRPAAPEWTAAIIVQRIAAGIEDGYLSGNVVGTPLQVLFVPAGGIKPGEFKIGQTVIAQGYIAYASSQNEGRSDFTLHIVEPTK